MMRRVWAWWNSHPGTHGYLVVILLLPFSALFFGKFAGWLFEDRPPQERVAAETTRVDYTDGVSCYHRGHNISCVYVPSRVQYGPPTPAVLLQDVLEPEKPTQTASQSRRRGR